MENDIKQRIKTLLKAKNINVNILSKELGIPQNSLNRQINNETTLPTNTILSIIGYFDDLSSDWLLTGKGEMLKPQQPGINNKFEGSFSGGSFVGGHNVGDVISGNGIKGSDNYATTQLTEYEREMAALKSQIELQNKLLEEKERLIQILLDRK